MTNKKLDLKGKAKKKVGFLGERFEGAINHGIEKVLLPWAKQTVDRFIAETVHWFIFKEAGGYKHSSTGRLITDYSGSSKASGGLENKYSSFKEKLGGYKTVVFDERDDAEAVLNAMKDLAASEIRIARVADLYDFAQMTQVGQTQYEKIGWNLDMLLQGEVSYNGDGFEIKLPKPKPISDL